MITLSVGQDRRDVAATAVGDAGESMWAMVLSSSAEESRASTGPSVSSISAATRH
jgi:hypothetical protein